jgi:hypothetical protein
VRSTSTLILLAFSVVLGSGCDGAESSPDDGVASQSEDIAEGTIARDRPEAVHVNLFDEYGPAGVCSGALIAPTVVLTAGHCVDRMTSWAIVAPFADGQWTRATRAEVYDWDVGMDYSFAKHDVAVILLDEPITIDSYPGVASQPVEHGSEAVVVGRTLEGRPSDDWLFESEPIVLLHRMAGVTERPRYYLAPERMIEPGDSGGPVYAYDPDGDAPRTIVGIASATQYVFRVEKLHDWVTSFVEPR